MEAEVVAIQTKVMTDLLVVLEVVAVHPKSLEMVQKLVALVLLIKVMLVELV